MNQSKNNSRKIFLFYDKNEFLGFLQSLGDFEIYLSSAIIVSDDPEFLASTNELPYPIIAQCKVNQYLGQELRHIFYDARSDFSPNAFAAIIGCLVGGGSLLLLLSKTIRDLIATNDVVTTSQNKENACLIRLVTEFTKIQSTAELSAKDKSTRSVSYKQEKIKSDLSLLFFEEQSNAIERIKRVSLGHANRPLVLTASRGRGKSAALGIAAAELVFEKQKEIIVTSPIKAHLGIFFSHFKNRLSELTNRDICKTNALEELINFVPLDKLTTEKSINKFLIVEEAGAIPVQILKKISNRANRVVYSTTTDGYEGNGQGFKIRFKDFLDSKFRQWKSCQLTHPARYPQNDPIEKAVNNALLFSNQQTNFDFNKVEFGKVEYRMLAQNKLKNNEPLLKQVYNLLLTAHYQTRPSDLERLLSDKNILIYIASYNNQVLSTALVLLEGSLTEKQCSKIEQGKLRLAGHLLPQSLMAHQGIENAGLLVYWRVMRIATHSQFRSNSLASEMINKIKKEALSSSVEILGASFALQSPVVNFWYKQGFTCNRIGLKKDSSTGELSCEFLFLIRNNTNRYNHVFAQATDSFNQHFLFYLTSNYCDIEVDILSQILTQQVVNGKVDPIYSKHELVRYIEQARSFEMVEWHLYQFLTCYIANSKTKFDDLSNQQKILVFRKVLQNTTWKHVIEQLNYSGKKDAADKMREVFRLLINTQELIDKTKVAKHKKT